jgi:hypothetical protein
MENPADIRRQFGFEDSLPVFLLIDQEQGDGCPQAKNLSHRFHFVVDTFSCSVYK